MVKVLPEPVTPSSTWSRSCRAMPSTSSPIACGWSPFGSYSDTSSKGCPPSDFSGRGGRCGAQTRFSRKRGSPCSRSAFSASTVAPAPAVPCVAGPSSSPSSSSKRLTLPWRTRLGASASIAERVSPLSRTRSPGEGASISKAACGSSPNPPAPPSPERTRPGLSRAARCSSSGLSSGFDALAREGRALDFGSSAMRGRWVETPTRTRRSGACAGTG